MGILGLLVLLFVVETLGRGLWEIREVEICAIFVRTASQMYRMVRLMKQEKEAREVANLDPVDLSFDQENFVNKFH